MSLEKFHYFNLSVKHLGLSRNGEWFIFFLEMLQTAAWQRGKARQKVFPLTLYVILFHDKSLSSVWTQP